ncbi:MAG: hypothetical protein KF871_15305 [Hydrogenophaga sp.]|uniref:hypothetical protein n=1 Tax=Hydrogenophaga sp. TaxID=1904254 RepID=UPI001DBFC6B2|nr:hypothetical protein [Hydrogenophaga sp.]MBX3611258.1 hypothetical protein [Hydrogenophaga sp.]
MSAFQQSDFIAHALRMVVPMRREFGRSVNVQTMLADPGYAQEVCEVALGSTNAQLREQAAYLQRLLGGPRQAAAAPAQAAAPSVADDDDHSTESERLRSLQAEKYRRGVR